MKTILSILLISCVFACKTGKDTSQKTIAVNSVMLESACDKGYTCTFEVMKNKQIDYTTSKAGTFYPEFSENAEKTVIKYEYAKETNPAIADGHYREEIYFEIPKETDEFYLEDEALQEVKFLFGRFCYCKNSTGYYKVKKGFVKLNNGKLTFSIENESVPQKIGEITGTYE